ncbi:hypothetical protein J6Y50_08615 [bacterium]|nr:hypothetical protein [bacterium]
MKKLFILTAVFSAMFLMMSCGGGSGLTGDGYYSDGDKVCSDFSGDCKGHEVRACVEGDDYWYEVEGTGKKFECKADGDCTKAAVDLNNYCYDTNVDYEDEDGTVCVATQDSEDCNGKPVKYCSNDDSVWYEVDNKKFECDENDCTQAAIELHNYCYDTNIEYTEEDGATCVTTEDPDECGGKALKQCTKDESYWYEVDGKKYECMESGSEECVQAMSDLTAYCDAAEKEKENGESGFATEPEAYLPASYADKTLDAWYMLKEADEDKIKIEAVFLFNDNTLVVTSSKVYSVEDGREPEKKINAEGTFEITSGDYDNGEAHVVAGEMEFDVTISDGILSAMDAEFAKQDNADAPEAQ